jgi:precorrin-8X/cobalt-precorrin-8 methylmutase
VDYIRDPGSIYAKSFSIIRAECDFSHVPVDAEPIAVRMIHACGVVDFAKHIVITTDFCSAAMAALTAGRPILVDVEMVRQGIIPRFIKTNKVLCTLNDPRAREIGVAQSTTRSAAALELWKNDLEGAFVVIGNAPTALYRLLELIDAGARKPAAIAGFPVGFVGAAESKEELMRDSRGIAFATIRGRMGGSAMAAAVINALLEMAA